MSNPNRVLANMSKNPWHIVNGFRSLGEAEAEAKKLKAEGKKTRITSYRYGPRKAPKIGFNLWTVEP
jgi:hypothetical protein